MNIEKILNSGFYSSPKTNFNIYNNELPYSELGGYGFERLCYVMLLQKFRGKSVIPHTFGKKGARDYGVDLYIDKGSNHFEVYQCKNYDHFTLSTFKEIVEKIKKEWIDEQKLIKPHKIIICCPGITEKTTTNQEIIDYKKDFTTGNGIEIDYWDKNYFNKTLKELPDIVADMFGNEIAGNFCNVHNHWYSELFTPVTKDSPNRTIKNYFDLVGNDTLYIPDDIKIKFLSTLKTKKMLLVKGCPGTGKTTMSLGIANKFYEESENKNFYLYYLNIKMKTTSDVNSHNKIWNGLILRKSIPTVFVFDDIQANIDLIDNVINKLHDHDFEGKNTTFIIFIYRKTLVEDNQEGIEEEEDSYSDDISKHFKNAEIRFKNDHELFRQIILKKKPGLKAIIDDNEQLTQICHLAGMDLVILDYIIDSVSTPRDLADLKKNRLKLYKHVISISKYFKKGMRYDGVIKSACLAQFDIGIASEPGAGYWEEINKNEKDKKILNELCEEAGGFGNPFKYYFLHSSLAELLCRSLAVLHNYNFVNNTVEILTDYFSRYIPNTNLNEDLKRLFYNHLKIPETPDENKIIIMRFLNQFLPYVLKKQNHIDIIVLINILSRSDDETRDKLLNEIISDRININNIVDYTIRKKVSISSYPSGLYVLRRYKLNNTSMVELENAIGCKNYIRLIKENGTFFELIMILAYSTPAMHKEIVDNITNEDINIVIEKTITSGRSIGTINLGLMELKKNSDLLKKLEKVIGYKNYIRLIKENGTFFELIMLIQYSTPPMQKDIIDNITNEDINIVIEKTITSGRSIGTIDLGLKELKKNSDLLIKLEKVIGYKNYIRLIKENGTFFELIMIIRHSTPAMQKEIVNNIGNNIDELVNKAIREKKSFGSMHWALRDFRKNHLLDKFMNILGITNIKKILITSGYPGILPDIYRYFTYTMQKELIALITSLSVKEKEIFIANNSLTSLSIALSKLNYFDSIEVKEYYTSFIKDYITGIDIEYIKISDTKEKINFLSLLSRFTLLTPAIMDTIVSGILLEDFIKTENFLQLYSILLSVIAGFPGNFNSKQKIVDFASTVNVLKKIKKEKNFPIIFWFLWNYYSIQREEMEKEFFNPDHPVINEIIIKMNSVKHNRLDPAEKCFYIALAGFLFFYNITSNHIIHTLRDIRIDMSNKDFLINFKYNAKDFIPAFFYIKGVEIIINNKMKKNIVEMIIPKLDYYINDYKTLAGLKDHLRNNYGISI